MDTKPLNVQFEIKDEQDIDALLELATQVGKKRNDRRLRAANVAKEVLLRVMHDYPELLKEFFEDETSVAPLVADSKTEYVTSPKAIAPAPRAKTNRARNG